MNAVASRGGRGIVHELVEQTYYGSKFLCGGNANEIDVVVHSVDCERCLGVKDVQSLGHRLDSSSCYFAISPTTGLVKIGASADPSARARSLHAVLVAIEAVPDGSSARYLERQLHHRFESLSRGGEWFELGPELREHIDALRAAAPDPQPPITGRVPAPTPSTSAPSPAGRVASSPHDAEPTSRSEHPAGGKIDNCGGVSQIRLICCNAGGCGERTPDDYKGRQGWASFVHAGPGGEAQHRDLCPYHVMAVFYALNLPPGQAIE